jgi:hypothetical protein
MIGSILRAAARLDAWLRLKLGRPYGVMLTAGLVAEVVHRLIEMSEHKVSAHRLAAPLLFLVLNLALLVHQVGDLSERMGPREPGAGKPD